MNSPDSSCERGSYRAVHHADAIECYDVWKSPTVIVSDGAYGVPSNTFEGDPNDPHQLAEWYRPHIEAWSEHATPSTTLWFWCSDIGWAHVHPVLEANGWEYRGANVWDKGMEHIAGHCNTGNLRKFPQVTELCVQYIRSKEAVLSLEDDERDVQQWMRDEWERTGLPFEAANEACGVEDAATRRYLTPDNLWYFPPPERFEKLRRYANEHGDPSGRPYFDSEALPYDSEELNGMSPVVNHRAKFDCPAGVTNVWREGHTTAKERVMETDGATHPNQKPLSLMRRAIDASSDRGDVIWEPFGGLCTASVAAVQLDRRPFAAETEADYVALARERIANAPTADEIGQQKIANFATDGDVVAADGGDAS